MTTAPETLLGGVTRRLAAEFNPERVILFGSRAWGTPTEDSDVDLLVIVARSAVPTDVIVKTGEAMGRYGSVPSSPEAEILERGRVIHGRGEERAGPGLAHEGVA